MHAIPPNACPAWPPSSASHSRAPSVACHALAPPPACHARATPAASHAQAPPTVCHANASPAAVCHARARQLHPTQALSSHEDKKKQKAPRHALLVMHRSTVFLLFVLNVG